MVQVQDDSYEPDMVLVSDIQIVDPSARIPLGQYIKVSPRAGIMWPAVPFGPRGAEMAGALDKMLKALMALYTFRDNLMSTVQAPVNADPNVVTPEAPSISNIIKEIEIPAIEFYKAGLMINYGNKKDMKIVDWIMDNMPVNINLATKLVQAAQGEIVDAETFPGQS